MMLRLCTTIWYGIWFHDRSQRVNGCFNSYMPHHDLMMLFSNIFRCSGQGCLPKEQQQLLTRQHLMNCAYQIRYEIDIRIIWSRIWASRKCFFPSGIIRGRHCQKWLKCPNCCEMLESRKYTVTKNCTNRKNFTCRFLMLKIERYNDRWIWL